LHALIRYLAQGVHVRRLGASDPEQILADKQVVVLDCIEQLTLGELNLAQGSKVRLVEGNCLLQECFAVCRELLEFVSNSPGLLRRKTGREFIDIICSVAQFLTFLVILNHLQTGCSDLLLAFPGLLAEHPRIRQFALLFEQHPTQRLAETRQLDFLPGAAEFIADLLYLCVYRVIFRSRLFETVCQYIVGLIISLGPWSHSYRRSDY